MTYVLCCSKCGKKLATTPMLEVDSPIYFNCHMCEVKSIKNAAYLAYTGQGDGLIERHVPDERVEEALKSRKVLNREEKTDG